MKKDKIITCLLLAMLLISGCGNQSDNIADENIRDIQLEEKTITDNEETKMGYIMIPQDSAYQLMNDDSLDVVVVDVRTDEEFDEGHIPGAICIPNEVIEDEAEMILDDKDQTILVYCRSGRRSKEAAAKLVDLGYTDIREFGGIIDWQYDIVESE